MKIVGCGSEHQGWWKSYGALNPFCGLCGKRVNREPITEKKTIVAKIQITHRMHYENSKYSFYFMRDGKMYSPGSTWNSAETALVEAKSQALHWYKDEAICEFEVWLDEPVATRNNRRINEWEK